MEIDIAMNGQVFLFALFLSLITGAVFGLLLVFAGLFLRSLGNASTIDPGFEIRNGVVVTFELGEQGYDLERALLFERELVSRVESLPAVESASFAEIIPLGAAVSMTSVYPQTPHVEVDEDGVSVDYCAVDPNYFRTMGIPVVSGRSFTEQDIASGTQVAIINETMAHRYWPGESAIGQQILRQFSTRDDEVYTVIGVARDGRYRTLGEEQRSYFYRPTSQEFSGFTNLIARTSVNGSELLLQVREQIRAIDIHLVSMLYGINPVDTLTFFGVFLLFLAVAFAATYMPAKKASDINPVEALRYE